MRKDWTTKDLAVLHRDYPHMSAAAVARTLGRTQASVSLKAFKLKLDKTSDFYKITYGTRRSERVVATQFKPGSNCGNTNPKWVPIGTETIRADGYLWRKVSDTPKAENWKAVHLIAWEQAHGSVPMGHMVVFIDGNKANTDLSNLQLISRLKNLDRNSIHRYPPQLRKTIKTARRLERVVKQKLSEVVDEK